MPHSPLDSIMYVYVCMFVCILVVVEVGSGMQNVIGSYLCESQMETEEA